LRLTYVLWGALLVLPIPLRAQGPAGVGSGRSLPRPKSGSRASLEEGPPRWQIGIGYQYNRINLTGTPFNTHGANTNIVHFFGRWVGVEGQVGVGFGNAGPATSPPNLNLHSLFAGGGLRLALRGHGRIEPWVHGDVGREFFYFTQTAGVFGHNSSLGGLAGGGMDFVLSPHTAFRTEGDWLGTQFFSLNQSNFQVNAGLVFNF
jgi:hypothetical protein